MIWPLNIIGSEKKSARIVNTGTCKVTLREKSVSLSVDWAPNDYPEFVVYVRSDATWDNPVGERISKEELSEIMQFIPAELLKRDSVEAVIKLVSV